ncbi:cytochrome P450 [Nocardioides limicola]|uniref:cytochrome P450 n=1 Tax=Nocardioides limicola TaxID=2803368 RepID=UPI00193BF7F6|nr:cytochrome P450 [Nocardioides sp. DJM-14]
MKTIPDLGNPDTYADGFPYDAVGKLRRDEPVVWCPEAPAADFEGGPGFWFVTRHADVVEVSKRPDVFSSHVGGTSVRDFDPKNLAAIQQMMLNLDPPDHSQIRKIISRAFTPRTVKGMFDSIDAHADRVIADLGEGGDFDLVPRFSAEMPLFVLADILGIPSEERHLLFDWTNRMVGFDDPAAGDRSSYVAAFMELFAYAHDLTQQKRANPTDDVWSMIVNAEVDGERLSDDDLDRFFQLLVIAGNETTRNLLNGFVLTMSQHPDQFALLRSNPDLLERAVEEVLRWHPPILQFRRTAVADHELRGQQIRAGDKVVISYASANRDEDVFDEPDRFDITRSPNPHLAFGTGQHFCLGNAVARLEARVLLSKLLDAFDSIEVTGPPVRLRSNFVNGITELPVRMMRTVDAQAG